MVSRTVYLVSSRLAPSQRAHFAIFIPSDADPQKGTLINVVGAPMIGYSLEFKRNYAPATDQQHQTITPIGQIDSQNLVDFENGQESADSTPRGNVEIVAARVVPPRIGQNFMAPVNDTTNRRCQEWTVHFVWELVQADYIGSEAIDSVDSQRDPPNHGIGLQPVKRADEKVPD